MYFSILFNIVAVGAHVLGLAFTPRQHNGCFDVNKGACVGRQADVKNATIAITNACNKVTSCTPGEIGHGRSRVVGKYPISPTLRSMRVENIEWLSGCL